MTTKATEIADPASCLNKAADDEVLFVLRAKDPLAAGCVRHWATMAELSGRHERERILEARALANRMEEWHRDHRPLSPGAAWPFPPTSQPASQPTVVDCRVGGLAISPGKP